MPEISARGLIVPESPIRKLAPLANAAKARGTKVYHLNIGQPDVHTPQCGLDALKKVDAKVLAYSPSQGIESYRNKLVGYYAKHNINLVPDDIIVTTGGSEALLFGFMSTLNPGDEIIITEPAYANYMSFALMVGAKVRSIHTSIDNGFALPAVEEFEKLINANTRAILICNPNNPTGSVYPREVLEGIVEVARRHQLMIFADEIYDRLCMDGYEHVSIASLAPDLPCVTFSGLSKSHMIAGYRIGWMVLSGNQRCMSDFIMGVNMLSNMRLCSNVPAQSIVQTALGGHQSVNDYIRPGGRVYEQRNFVYEALNKIDGISVVKPRAAFYIFPKMDVKKFNITDDEQFALDLLHEKKILITRGGGFNWAEPDHFRIVYLPRIEVLSEAMRDLEEFLSTYRQ